MTPSVRGPIARRVAVLVLLAAAWLVAAPPAAAHAELAASEPVSNAALTAAPDRIDLTFTEPIDPLMSRIELLDELGAPVAGVGPVSAPGEGFSATVALPHLDAGIYVVRYQVLSTVDGHVTGGSFAFGVDPSGTAPPPTVSPTTTSPTADPGVAVARWVGLASVLALAGTAFFWLVTARPVLAGAAGGAADGRRAVPRPWPLLAILALSAVLGIVVFLLLASRGVPGGGAGFPLDPAAAFGSTQFGVAMRVALLGAAVATVVAGALALTRVHRTAGRRRSSVETAGLALVLVVGLVTLAAFSSGGHVAALGGLPFAVLDFIHLAAVAAWLGSLPAFLVLATAHGTGDPADRRALLGAAFRRHSRVALVAAPLVALTGVANSPVVLGSVRNLVASDYGNLLLAKVLLFGTAIGIGAANFFLVRRLALRPLLATVGAEAAVAALAILTAAGLLTVPAAASRAPRIVTTAVPTAHLYGEAEDRSVHVILSLPSPGNQRYQVVVTEADGAPTTDLQRVFLTFVPPADAGLAETRVQLAQTDMAGVYGTTGAYTPVVGTWQVDVTLRAAGERDVGVGWEVRVVTAPPPEQLPPEDTGIGTPGPLAALWRIVPPSPYEWTPALGLFGLAGVLWLIGPTGTRGSGRRDRVLVAGRVACVVLGVGASLVAGSQALVRTANAAPDAPLPTENPVAATAESITAGEDAYLAACSLCHGIDGAGDGPGAGDLPVAPGPLGVHVPHHTDAELYAYITRGISGTPMPGFATELLPEDRWNLINYLRSRWPAP